MDFPLVYAALKDGRLNSQENPVPTIASSRFQRGAEIWLTLTGHFFAPIAFVANRAMFEQLDARGPGGADRGGQGRCRSNLAVGVAN